MSELFKQLRPILERNAAYHAALSLFSWDNETLAPENAIELTSHIIGTLSMESYSLLVNDNVKSLLEQLSKADDLTESETAIVRILTKQQEDIWKIPPEEYREYNELSAIASSIWAKAKEENNFLSFVPSFRKNLRPTVKKKDKVFIMFY